MTLPHEGKTLPAGVWYEATRHAYRVRVRRKNRIIHQTRHPASERGLEQALQSLRDGIKKRRHITKNEGTVGSSDADRVRALAEDLI